MSRMTNVDREFKQAISRFVREYNNEVLFLKNQLDQERRKTKRLEDIVIKLEGKENEQV